MGNLISFIDNSLVQLVLSSIVLPFIMGSSRWVINRRGYILVSKYELQTESTNWLMWYCKWWKIAIMPMILGVISMLLAMYVSGETLETNDVVFALAGSVFVLGGIGYALAIMKRVWFVVLLELSLSSAGWLVVFAVLIKLVDLSNNSMVAIVIIVSLQISSFHVIMSRNGYYDDYATKEFQIADYVLSVCMAVSLISNKLWIYVVLAAVIGGVLLVDRWRWITKENKDPIKKDIIMRSNVSGENECTADGTIRVSSEGLCIENGAGQKIHIPSDNVSRIVFDTYKKYDKLSNKIDDIKDMSGTNVLPSGQWYVRMNPQDWLWVCSWNGELTKNIIYSTKNISWSATEEKRFIRWMRKDF